MDKNRLLQLYLLLFILTGIVFSFYYATKPLGDYANYYFGSKFILSGVSPENIYDPANFNLLIEKTGVKEVFVNYAPVPPFSLLFFSPFSFLNAWASKVVFNILGVMLFAFSLYRLFKSVNLNPHYILPILAIISIPIRNNLILGQTYLWISFFLIEGYLSSNRGKNLQASLFFALPIALKIFPAILLLWLAFTGRTKQFFYTILISSLLFVSTIPLTGMDFMWQYCTDTLPRLSQGEINDPYAVSYQSFNVLTRKLLVHDPVLNPEAPLNISWLFLLLNAFFAALILTWLFRITKKETPQELFTFGFTFFSGLLITGYGTNYGLVILFFLSLSIVVQDYSFRKKSICLSLLLITCCFPVHLTFGKFPLPFQFIRFYAMLFLFLYLVTTDSAQLHIRSYLVILSILLFPVLLRSIQKTDASSYYLPEEPSLLITDFKTVPEGIMISYRGIHGIDSLLYETTDQPEKDTLLTIQNDQIYYANRRITRANDHKQKAMLLNDREIIYLSDQGRGVGLYGLRKIPINPLN